MTMMMIRLHCLALFLVSSMTLVSFVDAELGLFVFTRFRNWTSPSEALSCEASSCETRLEEGCIPQIAFSIADVCYKLTNGAFSQDRGSERRTLVNGGTEFCWVPCSGDELVEDFEAFEATCTSTTDSLGVCTDDEEENGVDPSSEEYQYLQDFCIESSIAVGEYTTPFYENRLYESIESCQSSSEFYLTNYLPADDSLCWPAVPVVDDEVVFGSYTRKCNADGTTTTTRYTDSNCMEQDPGLLIPLEWTIDGCTPRNDDGTPQDPSDGRAYTADCSTPKFYCKDMSAVNFITKIDDGSTQAPTESAAPTPAPTVQELGIFVRRRWVNFTSATTGESCEATSCESRLEEGCLPRIDVRVENTCTRYEFDDFSRSWATREMLVNETHACTADCGECTDGCDDLISNVQSCSFSPYELGECRENDPSRTEALYYPNFCIQSSEPMGEFTNPLYDLRGYASQDTCESNSEIFNQRFVPGNGNHCAATSLFTKDDSRYLGSGYRQCNDDGTHAVKRFTDDTCSEYDPDVSFLPQDWLLDGCTARDMIPGEDEPPDFRYTVDCSTPVFYCKDFSVIEFFSAVGDGEGVSPSGSPTQTPEEADDDDDSDGSISTFLNTLTVVVCVSLAGLFL